VESHFEGDIVNDLTAPELIQKIVGSLNKDRPPVRLKESAWRKTNETDGPSETLSGGRVKNPVKRRSR
jgi:hypothetical protein